MPVDRAARGECDRLGSGLPWPWRAAWRRCTARAGVPVMCAGRLRTTTTALPAASVTNSEVAGFTGPRCDFKRDPRGAEDMSGDYWRLVAPRCTLLFANVANESVGPPQLGRRKKHDVFFDTAEQPTA
jgi:hypothetical protein